MVGGGWHVLSPEATGGEAGGDLLRLAAHRLAEIDARSEDGLARIRRVRRRALADALDCSDGAQIVRVWASVLCDLRAQAWDIRVRKGAIEIHVPTEATDQVEEKARVRAGLLVERDQQLSEPSVRRFVVAMEGRRTAPSGEWVSVFSLMRDGRDLAKRIRQARHETSKEARADALDRIIRPYIQIVDDSVCPHTGLRLKDIWRYFRYTWTSPHKNLPGRNLWLLIRDAAADHHPVLGIAALGSAVVQLRIRDSWIGWTAERFVAQLRASPTDDWAKWVDRRLRQQFAAIYTQDLRGRKALTEAEISQPTADCVQNLRSLAKQAREAHRLYGSAREHKATDEDSSSPNWEDRARTHLFISKRAATLADVLEDRLLLQRCGFSRPTSRYLAAALDYAAGRKAIARILRRTKAEHVGIDMLDITLCGSIPPYTHILGGKLVSLLLTSPEVRFAYEQRYGQYASVIASSMAGRAIRRPPRLVLLGTTSLYGVGSSQYNRLRMPAEEAGGNPGEEIRYIEQGVTEGFGSYHFSAATLKEIRALHAQTGNGRRVKHIFGEGVNPRMREVREALDRVGLPSDRLLRHGNGRVVYSIPLATNFREVLMAQSDAPDYILPGDEPVAQTKRIAAYWTRRWLAGRIMREGILEAVARHSLSYPIEHGARVSLPPNHEQTPLFADTSA